MKEKNKQRAKTTLFWSGLASAILIFLQNVATLFGFELTQETIVSVMTAVNSLLAVLAIGGFLVDTGEVDSFQQLKAKAKSKDK